MCYKFKYFQIDQRASKNEKNVAGVDGSTSKKKQNKKKQSWQEAGRKSF